MAKVLSDRSQEDMALGYLKKATRKGITPMEAWQMFGIMRLAAVVCRLRRRGWDIITTYDTRLNKYGKPCRVTVYKLVP